MGMYTELFICTNLRDDKECIDILKYMIEPVVSCGIPKLPNHDLFKNGNRWEWMLHSCSHYFVPRSSSLLEYSESGGKWAFINRSDLKNYSSEIQLFVDWLMPYIDTDDEEMIGYM